jgi:hypothetical protein
MLDEWFEVYKDNNVWYVLVSGISGTKRLGPFREYDAAVRAANMLRV